MHSLPEDPSNPRPLLSPSSQGPHYLCICFYQRHRLNSTGWGAPDSTGERSRSSCSRTSLSLLSMREVATVLGCPGHSDYLQCVCVCSVLTCPGTQVHWPARVPLPSFPGVGPAVTHGDTWRSPTFAEDSMELQSSKAWQKMVASLLSRSWILVSKSS